MSVREGYVCGETLWNSIHFEFRWGWYLIVNSWLINSELYLMIVIRRSVVWPVNTKLIEILLWYWKLLEVSDIVYHYVLRFDIVYMILNHCQDNMLFFKLGNLYCLINQLSWDYSPFSSEDLLLVITLIREIPYTLTMETLNQNHHMRKHLFVEQLSSYTKPSYNLSISCKNR